MNKRKEKLAPVVHSNRCGAGTALKVMYEDNSELHTKMISRVSILQKKKDLEKILKYSAFVEVFVMFYDGL
jgi:hypothetical protein